MKITFICGSLEQGHDGVGDYSRRLAGELIRNGYQASIIAFNDQSCNSEFYGTQESEGTNVPVLRLPSSRPPTERFRKADKWISDLDPDWLSLQFVPFAFHPKGLSFGTGRLVKKLVKKRHLHIMFHELWLGMHKGTQKKEALWGFIQRQAILSMIARLKPDVIHTQSSLYRSYLDKAGITSSLLPLFSNIKAIGHHSKKETPTGKISLVLFGGIHAGAPVEEFAKEIKEYTRETGTAVSVTVLGRGGNEQDNWLQAFNKHGLEIIAMGEQPPEEISGILSASTFGITTTVLWKVEKSGSIAAMIEHGLNIICVAAAWEPKLKCPQGNMKGVYEYKKGNLASILRSENEPPVFRGLEDVAGRLALLLLLHKNKKNLKKIKP